MSYLIIVDDLLFFDEASLDQDEVIRTCLREFSEDSSARVNKNKTVIYFSIRVDNLLVERLLTINGFVRTRAIGNYLSVPIFSSRVTRHTLTKFWRKLKENYLVGKLELSLVGRLTLFKLVFQSLPQYSMHSSLLPKAMINDLECITCSFLWVGNLNSKRYMLFLRKWLLPKKSRRAWYSMLIRSKYGIQDEICLVPST